ncbi:Oxidoreductase sirO [Hyphodiscus hymeniophilus]|uniref:Oxidoreductase sirO n=1 Tax=Hyphodiscus hymeniophilus TaxID=353542 RepID=A0A9P6VLZ2_9HELO|nr:Oxidoreductase sirO [Hyphodiscus hymeniophilus]
MATSGASIVFGGASLGFGGALSLPDKVEEVFKALEDYGVKIIDTAQAYGTSEDVLGQTGAASRFAIDTKYPGGLIPNDATTELVIEGGKESLKKLKAGSVDVFYIHMPDRKHPVEPVLSGINDLYKSGMCKRFGLSNFSVEEVEEVIHIAKEKNYVLPTVYQGLYSAVARRAETELLPTLRKHGIAFYAYSPIAGGFLTKSRTDFEQDGKGRWDPATFLGQLHNVLYKKPGMLEALDRWEKIAKEVGISKAELAYRWVAYNSMLKREQGDAIIIGASSIEQLKGTLEGLENGPLSREVEDKIDEIWKLVEHESPLNNLDGFTAMEQK